MSKIAFFCIPAHGHTNPTLEVVKELIQSGNEVWYYSYDSMKEKIESTGARYVSCDCYDMQLTLTPEDGARLGSDLAFSTEVLVETTLAVGAGLEEEMKRWQPDCIVADSMAVWGKAIARKLDIPFVSSTTTFAFNQQSSKVMKQSFGQMAKLLLSMGKIHKQIKRLQRAGYPVKNVLDIIQNDNDTNTIVYTSPEFQPCAETFSDKYLFVGPSIRGAKKPFSKTLVERKRKQVYISLGTVNNDKMEFYKNCIEAFRDAPLDVVISVGEMVELERLKDVPKHIQLVRYTDQIAVLQNTDAFLTHCGMNSVSEALYFQVPLVLYPQTDEQKGVACRVKELGAGQYLEAADADAIRKTVEMVLADDFCRENAKKIAESFYRCGGAVAAAKRIEKIAAKRIEKIAAKRIEKIAAKEFM